MISHSFTKDGVDGQYAWCALQVDEDGVLVEGRLAWEILVIFYLLS